MKNGWDLQINNSIYPSVPLKTLFFDFYKKNKALSNVVLSLSYGQLKYRALDNSGLLPESFESYNCIRPGMIVLRLTDLQNDIKSIRVATSDKVGVITSAYTVLKNKNRFVNNQFFGYVLKSFDALKYIYTIGGGVRQAASYKDLRNILLPNPSLQDQTTIANYLDRHTAKIDREVELLEHRIELTEEYRQALIYETVTKGLNRDAPMKASGVEWIGDIPSHWEVKRVKDFFKLKQGYSFNSSDYMNGSNNQLFRMGNIKKGGFLDLMAKPVYLPNDLSYLNRNYLLKNGDVLIAMTDMSPNLDFLGAPCTFYNNTKYNFYLNQRVGKIKKRNLKMRASYFKYTLLSNVTKAQFKSMGIGTIQGNMSEKHFDNLYIMHPPLQEQNAIALYLDQETSKLDQKLELLRKKVELLKEYKQSLIYEAVTGKIPTSEM